MTTIDAPAAHFLDDIQLRQRVLSLADEACDGDTGRQEGDPVFELVTEGRQSANTARRLRGSPEVTYSCCTDLAHYLLWRVLLEQLGDLTDAQRARATSTIGRTEAAGWRVGQGVSRLVGDPCFERLRGLDWSPPPGSIVVIGEHGAEHVLIVEDTDQGQATSLDYGQFWARPGQPGRHGGRRCVRQFSDRGGRLHLGGRVVLGHIDPVAWVDAVRSAF